MAGMEFEILPVTRFQQNCSILWCEKTNRAAVIDPGGDLSEILNFIELMELEPEVALVTHGHFLVNGKKVDIPSYRVSQYDIIDVREKSLSTLPFQVARETLGERPVPGWLQVVGSRLRVLVHQLPERAQIDIPLQEQLIVEYYSK